MDVQPPTISERGVKIPLDDASGGPEPLDLRRPGVIRHSDKRRTSPPVAAAAGPDQRSPDAERVAGVRVVQRRV